MNISVANEDKLKKLSSTYRGCIDRWLNLTRSGKALLDTILEIRKDRNDDGDKNETKETTNKSISSCHKKFTFELQDKCSELRNVAFKFDFVVKDLELLQEKVAAIVELTNFSNSQNLTPGGQQDTKNEAHELSKISRSLKTVLASYKEQAKLMEIVADNIGVCQTFDQVIFYAAIWTHQPSLEQNYFVADRILADIF